MRVRERSLAAAVFLIALSGFVLSGPGRIDSIDGQVRFDISRNLILIGRPAILDPYLAFQGIRGTDGLLYSTYGPAPSYLAVPLVWLGARLGDVQGELARFLFSWLNAIFVAGTVALLTVFYLDLGVSRRAAVSWALLAAFASMLWIGATTVLEQGQHALFSLAGLYLAWRAARRDSPLLAAAAGIASGTLILYQLPYVLHQPAMALATLARSSAGRSASDAARRGRNRFLLFGCTSAIALIPIALYNFNRFGVLLFDPPRDFAAHPPLLGNPLVGVPSLLFSPGKGILLFSPIVLLAIRGLWRLRSREARLVSAIAAVSALHLVLIGSLSIFHGDWCWGPRYLIVLLPIVLVGLPFSLEGGSAQLRRGATCIICLGLFSNVLGLSLVHERFFHEKGLAIYFWRDDPGFYFRHSNYFARFGEIARTLREGMPSEAQSFTNSPYPGLLTYVFVRGGPPQVDAPWVRHFRIFYRPRPWPFWLAAERANWAGGAGFQAFWWLVVGVAGVGVLGATWLAASLRDDVPGVPGG